VNIRILSSTFCTPPNLGQLELPPLPGSDDDGAVERKRFEKGNAADEGTSVRSRRRYSVSCRDRLGGCGDLGRDSGDADRRSLDAFFGGGARICAGKSTTVFSGVDMVGDALCAREIRGRGKAIEGIGGIGNAIDGLIVESSDVGVAVGVLVVEMASEETTREVEGKLVAGDEFPEAG